MELFSTCSIECLNMTGPSTIRRNLSAEYEINMIFSDAECNSFNRILTVFLSYGGSTMIRNKDFVAPNKIVMEKGVIKYKFPIKFYNPCTSNEDKYIQITMTADYTNNICTQPLKTTITCIKEENENGDILPTYCDELFFFEPYGHKTKIPNNMK
jgi:hypothetical protein